MQEFRPDSGLAGKVVENPIERKIKLRPAKPYESMTFRQEVSGAPVVELEAPYQPIQDGMKVIFLNGENKVDSDKTTN